MALLFSLPVFYRVVRSTVLIIFKFRKKFYMWSSFYIRNLIEFPKRSDDRGETISSYSCSNSLENAFFKNITKIIERSMATNWIFSIYIHISPKIFSNFTLKIVKCLVKFSSENITLVTARWMPTITTYIFNVFLL